MKPVGGVFKKVFVLLDFSLRGNEKRKCGNAKGHQRYLFLYISSNFVSKIACKKIEANIYMVLLIIVIMAEAIKIGIVGLSGRMGQEIYGVLQGCREAIFVCGCSSTQGSMEQVFEKSDVVIDFSSPEAFFTACTFAKKYQKPLVSGTTGFSSQQEQQIKQISVDIVLVMAANMSFGVNLFFKFTKQMAQALKSYPQYDAEIIETHHINKKDAPSGTAITLGKKVAEGLGQNFEEVAKYGRNLSDGIKKQGEIGFSSIRSGGIIGEHTLIFASKDDRIELTHRAYNRTIFAQGAVDLVVRVFNTQNIANGLYEYSDFL